MGPNASQDWPIVVSYYTLDEIYEPAAMRLERSLDKYGIPHFLYGMDRCGCHHDHCSMKPEFVEAMMIRFRRDLVWMDADNEVLQEPSLLKRVGEHDLSVVRFGQFDFELNNSVIGISAGPMAWTVISAWIGEVKRQGKEGDDQKALHRVVQGLTMGTEMSIGMLPETYASTDPETAVLYQHHASVEARKLWPHN